jgi:GntR family phosphonate transport system transcriptional regulator
MPRATLWKSIADTLLAEIGAGHYRPGDRLPTEAQLAARFGVNRHTVRHALASLTETGLLHARRGSGVFVATRPQIYPLGRRVRFHQNVAASGRTPSRQILRLETRSCDKREAEALRLDIGTQVHVMEGLSLVDGAPLAVFRSVFPATPLPQLLKELDRSGSVTVALAACGVADYTRASTRLTAVAARATLALQLRLAEGAPILRSVAINHDAGGTPIEYGTTWFAGDRVELTVAPE